MTRERRDERDEGFEPAALARRQWSGHGWEHAVVGHAGGGPGAVLRDAGARGLGGGHGQAPGERQAPAPGAARPGLHAGGGAQRDEAALEAGGRREGLPHGGPGGGARVRAGAPGAVLG